MAFNNIELIIFDCDGVLIDSEVISGRVLILLLAELGVTIDFAHVQKNFIGRSFQKVAAEISETFSIKLPVDFEAKYRKKLLKAFESQLFATPNIHDILKKLSVDKCVATSSSPERVAKSLQITSLKPFFYSNIFTASMVENGKPAPDLFLFAAQQMNVKPENCLVIEDSQPGIQAAVDANMPVFHYTGGAHLKDFEPDDKIRLKPNQSFSDWLLLPSLLPHLFSN